MGSEELTITWNNHHVNVLGVFGRYLAEETLVDCTIAAEGECLKAHRLVLSACSTYFELLFSQERYKEKLVVLEDVKFKDLKLLIALMYEGQVTIPKDRLRDYVNAAELLQIRGLPRDLVLNPLREATEMSVECRKGDLASPLSHERMSCSAIGTDNSNMQSVSSVSGNQPVDETLSACMQMDSSEQNVYLHREYIQESDPTKVIAVFPGDKEASVEPKEELDVEDTPIWDCEDENTSTITDISVATAGKVVRSELPPVLDTITGTSFVSSSHILQKGSEVSFPKFTSVTAAISSSTNTTCSSSLVPNVTTEQSGCAMELSSSCKQTEMSGQIICVKQEPLLKTEMIPAVISLKRESIVEPMLEVWVEELQRYEDQDVISGTYSANTCNEQITIQDLDATVSADNCQSAVWRNGTFKALASACVEAQRVRKEVHSLEIKKETENDEECITGECSKIVVDDSTVDKVVESGLSVVEIDDDYAVKEEHVMEEQEIVETGESVFEADVSAKNSEVEEVDSIPFSERISMMLQRQSHRCLKCASVFGSVNELRLHVRNMHREKSSKCCEVCCATFPSRSSLMIHVRKHTNERPFKCNVCSASFKKKSDLKRHKLIHTDERPFQCDVCERSFRHRSTLANHKRTHTGERPFKCDVCSVSFRHNSHLHRHKLIHTDKRPFQCDVCEWSFRHRTTLANHKRTHTGERPFKCDVCSVSFIQKGHLKSHKLIHTCEHPFQCEECEMSFCHRATLAKHKRTHTGERPFKCDICKRAFGAKRTLINHMCTHNGGGNLQCDVCKKSFSVKNKLRRHRRTHTGKRPFQCNFCEKSFTEKKKLTHHICTHTGEQPYQCSVCQKSFTQKGHLTRHMRTHTGERPYQCSVCEKSFSHKYNLSSHLRTHTIERPFQCNVCQKFFKGRSSHTKHMITHIA